MGCEINHVGLSFIINLRLPFSCYIFYREKINVKDVYTISTNFEIYNEMRLRCY